jgi:transcriptional regulator with XRE-family HTH domain
MTVQALFITNLKGYRKLKNLSQFRLAERCDSTQTYIAEIEVGKKFPSIDMIERIASALDIESWLLFQNTPIPSSSSALPGASPKPTGLAPSQKHELINALTAAIRKIINSF